MPPDTSEIEREKLIAALKREGLDVTRHKLLRWVDAGLLPRPRREGLGRGKGSRSYYPQIAYLQARTLQRLLTDKRSLDEAGWGLWALGFPLTDWVRALLVDEQGEEYRLLKREFQAARRGRSEVVEAATQSTPAKAFRPWRKVIRAEAMPQFLDMVMAFQLGGWQAEKYSTNQLNQFQDIVVNDYFPSLRDDEGLPEPPEFAPELQAVSSRISLPKVLEGLRSVNNQTLDKYRNEFQWLTVRFTPSEERDKAIMDRGDFITFFKWRHIDPDGEAGIAVLMRSQGLDRPPPSQLDRWITGLRKLQQREESQ